jgi:hypothetical protein
MVISPFRQNDKLICIGTPKGQFLVKSAYHLEKNRFMQDGGESTTAAAHSRV